MRFDAMFAVAWLLLPVPSCGGGRVAERTHREPAVSRDVPRSPAEDVLDLETLAGPLRAPAYAEVRAAIARGDLASARATLTALAASDPDPEVRRAARVLAAWAARDASAAPGLVDELARLATEEPTLAPYLTLWAAERALRDADFARAEALAASVPPDTPIFPRARLVCARAAVGRGDLPTAERLLREHLAAAGDAGAGAAAARLELAECLATAGPARAQEAADLALEVRRGAPDGRSVQGARVLLERLAPSLSGLPAGVRRGYVEPTFDERVHAAERAFRAHRNEASETAWRALAESFPPDDARLCHARLRVAESVRKQRDHARAARLFDTAVDACLGDPERAPALFFGARSYEAAGDPERATALFQRLERELPAHTYADDARLRRADLLREAGDDEGFRTAAEAVPADFPDGDMRGEALFRLASWARARGDLAAALRYLDAHLAAVPREDGFRTAGRTLYWRGRVLTALGRGDEAAESFARAFREYPLSFYAVLALSRLSEDTAHADVARTLRDEVRNDVGDPTGWRFPLGPAEDPLRSAAFARAAALIRLGLADEAGGELSALAFLGADAPEERLWLSAVLFSAAGDLRASHDVVRRDLGARNWSRRYPLGPTRKHWLLAFPRPHADAVVPAATSEGLPPDLLWAIMREESAFDTGVESWANAVGLMQLIAPTARRFATPLALPHDLTSLRRPEVNVRIGAAFVRFLMAQFDGRIPLAVAGYNAGENAVTRWLNDCPSGAGRDQALDEWVEAIPYDETRGYTKRVVSTFATYRFLAAGIDGLPHVENAVPWPTCGARTAEQPVPAPRRGRSPGQSKAGGG